MGFHRRFISSEMLIDAYRENGIAGVREWFKSCDSIVSESGLASDVTDLMYEEQFNEIETWNKISKLISDASIKKGFKKWYLYKMIKFGLYIKNTSESNNHINTVEMPTVNQAEAYFAGVKQLSLEQFRNIYQVREVKNDSRNLLLG